MKDFEDLTKMNWFDFLLLKCIGTEKKSTKEIIASMQKFLPIYAPENRKKVSRVLFTQELDFLVDLGIVKKEKGVINFYEIQEGHKQNVMLLLVGLFGIFDLEKKRGID